MCVCPAGNLQLEAFLLSTGLVALAEIGDKTQLLAFLLAAKYKRPKPIILGILGATLLNHALAGVIGVWITAFIDEATLRWILGVSFIGMALWMLVPDRLDIDEDKLAGLGIFGTTFLAFFFAEMGDKTQIATVALAAQHTAFFTIVAGTTLG